MIEAWQPASAWLAPQSMHRACAAFDMDRRLEGASSHQASTGSGCRPLMPHLQPDAIVAHDVCHGPGGDIIIARAPGAAACAQRSSLKPAQPVVRSRCNHCCAAPILCGWHEAVHMGISHVQILVQPVILTESAVTHAVPSRDSSSKWGDG